MRKKLASAAYTVFTYLSELPFNFFSKFFPAARRQIIGVFLLDNAHPHDKTVFGIGISFSGNDHMRIICGWLIITAIFLIPATTYPVHTICVCVIASGLAVFNLYTLHKKNNKSGSQSTVIFFPRHGVVLTVRENEVECTPDVDSNADQHLLNQTIIFFREAVLPHKDVFMILNSKHNWEAFDTALDYWLEQEEWRNKREYMSNTAPVTGKQEAKLFDLGTPPETISKLSLRDASELIDLLTMRKLAMRYVEENNLHEGLNRSDMIAISFFTIFSAVFIVYISILRMNYK